MFTFALGCLCVWFLSSLPSGNLLISASCVVKTVVLLLPLPLVTLDFSCVHFFLASCGLKSQSLV